MSESIFMSPHLSKEEKYIELLPQLKALVESETDVVANLANTSAVLKEVFGWWWVGFYLVKGEELVLAPFQGTIACTRIKFGKGVCGTAWENRQSILVPDVEKFTGHIACSSATKSEIVVPVFNSQKEIIGVLDVDSEHFDILDATDVKYLEVAAAIVGGTL